MILALSVFAAFAVLAALFCTWAAGRAIRETARVQALASEACQQAAEADRARESALRRLEEQRTARRTDAEAATARYRELEATHAAALVSYRLALRTYREALAESEEFPTH